MFETIQNVHESIQKQLDDNYTLYFEHTDVMRSFADAEKVNYMNLDLFFRKFILFLNVREKYCLFHT